MSSYEKSILQSLRRVTRAIDIYSRRLASRHRLTGPQLVCLLQLAEQGEMTIGRLSEAVSVSPATVTGILDRLVKRGLVIRERGSTDRRRVYARLTERGRAVVKKAPSPLQTRFVERFDNLTEAEQSEIDRVLRRIVELMEAEAIDASPVLTTGPVSTDVADVVEFFEAGSTTTPSESAARVPPRSDGS